MFEEGIDHAVFVRQRAGVRLRRLTTRFRTPRLQRDDRQIAVERDGCEFFEIFLFRNALEIEQQQLDFWIFRHGDRQFADGDIRIVAGRVGVTHADALLAQEADRDGRERAALAQHRHVALGAVHIHEHGREAGDGAGAEIGEALRIRTDDPHPGLVRDLDHVPFLGLARNRVDFTETRRHHHRDLDATRRAILHRADGVVAGDGDDHHLRRFRQILQARIALVALHFRPRRIDRKNLALESELVEVMNRPAADLVGILRCADDGDGARIEGGLEAAHGLVLSKYGTRRSVNFVNFAVTLSPMARSLSPWAIMRKPSVVSTSTML